MKGVFLFTFLAACNNQVHFPDETAGPAEDSSPSDTTDADGDGDGYDPTVDCDDEDPAVNPGADELCNGVDDDCDGTIDEDDAVDAPTWYADTDGDGFGDAATSVTSCTQPKGTIEIDGDCNDADASRNPGAKELCNDIDDDCDGAFDEGFGTQSWYFDADEDGYGNAAVMMLTCYQPKGYIADHTDCDDMHGDISPGAPEVCEDGIDQDCNGRDTACHYSGDISLSSTGIVELVGEEAGDYAGVSVSNAGDVNGDGFDDVLVGAYRSDYTGPDSGTAYLMCGPITEDRDLSLADARLLGASAEMAGAAVTIAGDLNDDGYADILIGAPYHSDGADNAGAAYVVYGPVTGDRDLSLADLILQGEVEEDHAGDSVSCAGDVNDDGVLDILVGAPYNGDGGSVAGAAYIEFGPLTGRRSLSLSDVELVGESKYDEAGFTVADAGDLDGDGSDDVLVGTPWFEMAGYGSHNGAVYLLHGPITADRNLSLADVRLLGEADNDYFGGALSGRGDVNGDGFVDLLVGAMAESEVAPGAGAAYLFYGPLTAAADISSIGVKLVGESSHDRAGISVSSSRDLDDDGFADVLVSADWNDGAGDQAGKVYVLYGPVTGDRSLSLADARFEGEEASNEAGSSLSAAGDVDGDGFADIVVGAQYADAGGDDAGGAYLILSGSLP
jgi:hypothetical protein